MTALVCAVGVMAVGNAIICVTRVLYAGEQLLSAQVLTYGGLAVLLSLWALTRVRKQRHEEAPAAPVPVHHNEAPFEIGLLAAVSLRGASWLRWARRAATIGIAAFAVVTIISEWGTLGAGLDRLGDLHWHNLRWAVYAEVLAFISLAQLTRLLLSAGGARLRLGSMLGLTVASNAMTLTLPGGPAWATTFSFDQLRRWGVRASLSAYALAVTWLLSAVALLVIALVGIDLAGSAGPAAPSRVLATVAAALLASLAGGCLLLSRVPRCRARLGRELDRLASRPLCSRAVGKLRPWVDDLAGVRPSSLMLLRCFGTAILNWICDCGCLVFSILAVGGHVPWQAILAAYALTQLAAALPITPGGVGVVEGTLSVLLIAYHVPAATAVAAVILYRIISFWTLVPVGWATVGALLAAQHRKRRSAAPTSAVRRAQATAA